MILVFEIVTKDWNLVQSYAALINRIILDNPEKYFSVEECVYKRFIEPYLRANLDTGRMSTTSTAVIFANGLRHALKGDKTKIEAFCAEVKEATRVEIIPL